MAAQAKPRESIHEADISNIERMKLDIPYAHTSDAQKLDVFWPDEGDGPFPVIMSIHGGAFKMGDKRDAQRTPMLEGLKRGYAVVSWFPPTDFLMMDPHLEASGLKTQPGPDHNAADSPESLILGAQIETIPELVAKANPETYIHAGCAPMLIQHGNLDGTVPYQGSMLFAAKLAKVNGYENVTYDIMLNAGHGHEEGLFNTPQNLDKVFSFIDKALKITR